MSILAEIETLATHVAARATEDGTPFAEKVDALKTLTALYAILARRNPESEDQEGATLGDLASRIHGEANGNSRKVRSHRGT